MSNRIPKATAEKILFLPLNRLKKSPRNVRQIPHDGAMFRRSPDNKGAGVGYR
jgi:hypothetical protein